MNRFLGPILAVLVAVLAGVGVHLTGPASADPAAAASAVVDAYLTGPRGDRMVAATAALPDDAKGILVVEEPTVNELALPAGPEGRLTVVVGWLSSQQVADLGANGPVGVAARPGLMVLVAAPAGGAGLLPSLLAVVGALVAAGLAWVGRSRSGGSAPGTPTGTTARPDHGEAAAERATLVSALVELAEQAPPGLTQKVTSALAAVGVTAHSIDGQPFDPTWQTAVGSEPAPTPQHAQRVARTERPLFVDRGKRLNKPLVVVYGATATDVTQSGSA
jgi:hypothetical protein